MQDSQTSPQVGGDCHSQLFFLVLCSSDIYGALINFYVTIIPGHFVKIIKNRKR